MLMIAIGLAAALLGLQGCAIQATPAAAPGSRPNVVFVIADDMRSDGLWVMQSLNRLAANGVIFTRFFDTTPACCPSCRPPSASTR